MTSALLFLLPGLVALLLWLFMPGARASRAFSLAAAIVFLGLAWWLLGRTAGGEVLVHAFGAWQPPYGIAFSVDRLSALFVALHGVLLAVTLLALRPDEHGEVVVTRAHPLLFMLTVGLTGGFFTADLFNLFVMFELVLITSYLLVQIPGSDRSLAGLIPTVVINLVASIVFLAALGLLYGMCGSLNLADLAERLPAAPPALRRVALTMLVVAFGTKAALVPLCFWMPATYPTLSGPLAALFAGIMTKLGVYALLRTLPLLALDPLLLEGLVLAGGASALLGVLAALSQYEMRRLLAFHSVSQVGYMVLAMGLGTQVGIAAAVFFAVHHSLVKSALYLVADDLERRNGTRDLRGMDFRSARGTALVVCFIVAAFSLAGMPPFSGFVGKVSVFRAALEDDQRLGLVLLLVASVLTLVSMLKIWRFAFQQQPDAAETPEASDIESASRGAWQPLGVMLVLVLALGLGAGPAYDHARAAADDLLNGVDASLAADGVAGGTAPASMVALVRPEEVH